MIPGVRPHYHSQKQLCWDHWFWFCIMPQVIYHLHSESFSSSLVHRFSYPAFHGPHGRKRFAPDKGLFLTNLLKKTHTINMTRSQFGRYSTRDEMKLILINFLEFNYSSSGTKFSSYLWLKQFISNVWWVWTFYSIQYYYSFHELLV